MWVRSSFFNLQQEFDTYILNDLDRNVIRILKSFKESIDLEGIANHRGSSFGALPSPQPSQINFEHNIAVEIVKKETKWSLFIFLKCSIKR